MQEILIPSLVGALLAASWYWLMDLLPPFRAARRAAAAVSKPATAPAQAPVVSVPAPEKREATSRSKAEGTEAAGQLAEMLQTLVIGLVIARRQKAGRIGILQSGKSGDVDVVAVQTALGAGHAVTAVSAKEATESRYDLLISVGIDRGALPELVWKTYDWSRRLEDPARTVSIAVGTPRG